MEHFSLNIFDKPQKSKLHKWHAVLWETGNAKQQRNRARFSQKLYQSWQLFPSEKFLLARFNWMSELISSMQELDIETAKSSRNTGAKVGVIYL